MSQQDVPMVDDGSADSEHSSTDSYVSMTADQFEQNASFRNEQYDRVAQIFDGKWTPEHFFPLLRMGWTPQPPDVQQNWQVYVPEWTRPGWDPHRAVKIDGTCARATNREEATAMRPAILPGEQKARTDYTLYALGRFNDTLGLYMLKAKLFIDAGGSIIMCHKMKRARQGLVCHQISE